ncbi:MAG: hypothetical protein ACJAQT_002783 [Akkermansiaceae bacterium]
MRLTNVAKQKFERQKPATFDEILLAEKDFKGISGSQKRVDGWQGEKEQE